jgi:hypothetical protein
MNRELILATSVIAAAVASSQRQTVMGNCIMAGAGGIQTSCVVPPIRRDGPVAAESAALQPANPGASQLNGPLA